MNYYIAQTPTPTATPANVASAPLVEGGIAIAALGFFIREMVAIFKKKEADEAKLTTALIQDLRDGHQNQLQQQRELLLQLKTSHDQIAEAVGKMSTAIADINLANQQSKRVEAETFHAILQLQKAIVLMSEKLNAIHNHVVDKGFSLNGHH